jgi:peptide/nickel transport system substrate-binding protein
MMRFISASLAIASALAVAAPVARAARPHYGGTLSVQIEGTIHAFDPGAPAADATIDATAARVLPLVFETLVAIDPDGGLRPMLATAWEHDGRSGRWRFHLRGGVKLHDGSTLDAAHVATVLATRERGWTVGSDGDAVAIDPGSSEPDLPWRLAEPRCAIAVRTNAGALVGSGPFRVTSVTPARILLGAHDDYWGGRAFLDTVQIDQRQPLRDQLTNLEAGRIDVAAVRPTDVRRLIDRGLRTAASRPLALVALVFEPHRAQSADDAIRAALASAVDRTAMSSVLLQRQAEPALAFVPAWLSGYAPLLQRDVRARPSRTAAALPADRRKVILRVDSPDAVARTIAERIVVDAREAGLDLAIQNPVGLAPRPDVRLIRIDILPTTPERALARIVQAIGPRAIGQITHDPLPPSGAPIETVLRAERSLLDYDVLIPIVHVADVYGLGDRVESWIDPPVLPTGAWNFASVWLRGDRASAP